MGWLNKKKRMKVLKKFGVVAYYICDHCKKPIVNEFPVYDPKKGFYVIDLGSSMSSHFVKEPKVTYHSEYCNDKRLGNKIRRVPKLSKKQQRITDAVLEKISSKKIGWKKEVLFKKFPKFPERRIIRALKYLKLTHKIRKRKGAYVLYA